MDSRCVTGGDQPRRSETVHPCGSSNECGFGRRLLAVLFALVRSLTDSLKLGIVAALSWSLSNAVLLHATNAAEPMSGLFFSVCAFAIVIVSVRRGRSSLMIPAGLLLALAMASYQSMVFVRIRRTTLACAWLRKRNRLFLASHRLAGAQLLSKHGLDLLRLLPASGSAKRCGS